MKKYKAEYSTKEHILRMTRDRKPDFANVVNSFLGKTPKRPSIFELYLNDTVFEHVLGEKSPNEHIGRNKFLVRGFTACGYDYTTLFSPGGLGFPQKEHHGENTISLNEGYMITDRESYDRYPWPNSVDYDYAYLEPENLELPDGMKVLVMGPGGVLENLIALLGYNNLCIMLFEQPDFVKMVADKIGQIIYDYYEKCLDYDTVGGCFVNDDWGYKTQTMISPDDLRKYVIPWHKKYVELIHSKGKYAILHSCGMLWEVMDDIIDDMKFDAKHSYEDAITPVEESYERLKGRIAVMGGIDVDYMCKKTPEEIYNRSVNILKQTKTDGGYLLGTGNSVPPYVPEENYFAMISAALTNG